MAQQTLRAVDFAFKSFFGSVGKVKSARPPRYRKKGGLYKSKSGRLLNADVNGAANILRKSKQRLDLERLCVEFLDNPMRIRVA